MEWIKSPVVDDMYFVRFPTAEESEPAIISIWYDKYDERWNIYVLGEIGQKVVKASKDNLEEVKKLAIQFLQSTLHIVRGMLPVATAQSDKELGDIVRAAIPKGAGFILITISAPLEGELQRWGYVSNCERKDIIGGMETVLSQFKKNDPTKTN